jgi:hypothetical protein
MYFKNTSIYISDEKTFSLCKYTGQQWVQIPEVESRIYGK